ncbi:MAG: PHP domain-containing protein [Ignavibacteria bacterium]|nr:PHP domain-containing protein [Ignavibacteria bacterium]
MKVDLHLHTYYSDGFFSPFEIVKKIQKTGTKIISITDHDNIGGLKEAIRTGLKEDIEVIPGVEISGEYMNREMHILGYFIDPQAPALVELLTEIQEERILRIKKIIAKLNELGSTITYDDAKEDLKTTVSIGRPHIANALVKQGFVKSFFDAFSKYIGDDKVADVKKVRPNYDRVFKVIKQAGGLSFLAHPAKYFNEEEIKIFKAAGLDGIEVVHPSHNTNEVKKYKEIAVKHNLLTSGGSDFHGGRKNDAGNMGKYYISEKEIDKMRAMLPKKQIAI